MKPNTETGNATSGNTNEIGHYKPGHWFLNICDELSGLRTRQCHRELTHHNVINGAYAGNEMVYRG